MKHATEARELKEFTSAERLMVLHAEEGWLEAVTSGTFDFFTKLSAHVEGEAVASVVVTLGSDLSTALLRQSHIHLILGGAAFFAPNVLHVAPAYVWGFWYMDEVGINAASSIRLSAYHPEMVDEGHAEWFFNGVSSWNLQNNVSRSPQTERAPDTLEPAQSVVFCQEIEDRSPREHYLTTEQMVRNAARAAGGGIVYVKPHPTQSEGMRKRLERIADSDPNIRLSDASIHDLIEKSDWVISQNSAAGFEALMQRKRLVVCGPCDYHHAALTAQSEEELRHHLREGAGRLDSFDHARYFAWFLRERCLEPQADGFAQKAWARIKAKCMI
ncbi:MAG: hypothetical protein AAFY97_02820 [Pseudomonadota bacterium]